jgi:mannose-6-phosphate isomerase
VTSLYPLRLTPSPRGRIWGATDLRPYFGEFPEPIGEIWYSHEANPIASGPLAGRTLGSLMEEYGALLMGREHRPRQLVRRSAGSLSVRTPAGEGPYFPILVKMLFAARTLSVQVHPDDDYALEHEGGPGKTELWYVAAAEEGAAVALGLTEPMSKTRLAESARSGEIERFLNWIPVFAGDALYIPPGTLHTLGAGITICEIQQNSDLTYRFFDFGRQDSSGKPRELHIERGSDVARMDAPTSKLTLQTLESGACERSLLKDCPHFTVERWRWSSALRYEPREVGFDLFQFVEGEGVIGGQPFRAGDCFLIPAAANAFDMVPASPTTALRAFEPVQ